jgi:hypothetical protein
MSASPDPREAGERIERLLAELAASPDPRAAAAAEELVRCLVELYGGGLARIVELTAPAHVRELAADPLVESLLLVHDLHPLARDTRITRALERTHALLASSVSGLHLLGVDPDGVVHVRLTGARGCGTANVQDLIATAVAEAAPETSRVEVGIAAAPPPLLQISMRPGLAAPRS